MDRGCRRRSAGTHLADPAAAAAPPRRVRSWSHDFAGREGHWSAPGEVRAVAPAGSWYAERHSSTRRYPVVVVADCALLLEETRAGLRASCAALRQAFLRASTIGPGPAVQTTIDRAQSPLLRRGTASPVIDPRTPARDSDRRPSTRLPAARGSPAAAGRSPARGLVRPKGRRLLRKSLGGGVDTASISGDASSSSRQHRRGEGRSPRHRRLARRRVRR